MPWDKGSKGLLSAPLYLVLLVLAFDCVLVVPLLKGQMEVRVKCLRANVSLFLQIHAVDVEHGLQEALHSRATKHSDHQDLLLSFFSPFMSPSTGPNKSPCKTNS